jgi:asparagine synthase (glutamine-hydrolysing)
VVLSGEGADEVFAGYDYYRQFLGAPRPNRLIDLLRFWSRGKRLRLLLDQSNTTPSGFPLLTSRDERRMLAGPGADSLDIWEEHVLEAISSARDRLQQATAAEIATWLPADLLVKFDRMTMAHGLEGRAPYLDPKVVELGLNLPARDRMTAEQSKVALRRVAKRYLPQAILDRPKQGFVLPMRRWLAEWFEAHGGPGRYFAMRSFPGIDASALNAIVTADLKAGLRRERLVFALLMLVEWWHAFAAQRKSLAAVAARRTGNVAGAKAASQLAG